MREIAPLAVLLCMALGCSSAPQPAASREASGAPKIASDFGQPGQARSGARVRTHALPDASAGAFDYYLLTLSYSPEYCHSHPSAAECAAHPAFVLHGLWPENNDGTYPQNCSKAPGPANPAQYADIYPDAGLLQHEWTTHGTCSGLTPDAFFTAARAAFQSIAVPAKLKNVPAQISLPPVQIVGLFTQSNATLASPDLSVSCGNNYLTAVQVCLDKGLHPIACQAVKSCAANTVRIPAS